MAWAKGRQAAEETAKAECLRRWPELGLKCDARYYQGRVEGYVVTRLSATSPSGRVDIWDANGRTAADAWRACAAQLDD